MDNDVVIPYAKEFRLAYFNSQPARFVFLFFLAKPSEMKEICPHSGHLPHLVPGEKDRWVESPEV